MWNCCRDQVPCDEDIMLSAHKTNLRFCLTFRPFSFTLFVRRACEGGVFNQNLKIVTLAAFVSFWKFAILEILATRSIRTEWIQYPAGERVRCALF